MAAVRACSISRTRVWGPVTYDAVSLFKDAYVDLPEEFALDLLVRYWQVAKRLGLPIHAEFEAFYTDYEWMGRVQRHLKVLGIRPAGAPRRQDALPRRPAARRHLLLTSRRYGNSRPLRRLLERLHPEELAKRIKPNLGNSLFYVYCFTIVKFCNSSNGVEDIFKNTFNFIYHF